MIYDSDVYKMARARLVEALRAEGITDERVLNAIENVPRHVFVPEKLQYRAYDNVPLPITEEQTISQPYVVAKMTQTLLNGKHLNKVLEIGTGTAYQTAVLARLVDKVYTIERIESLHKTAKLRLTELGLNNVECRYGDGYLGWEEQAPFQGILVTAAAPKVPERLLAQLAEGGRMVIPIGELGLHRLVLVTREGDKYIQTDLEGVCFVPMLPGVR